MSRHDLNVMPIRPKDRRNRRVQGQDGGRLVDNVWRHAALPAAGHEMQFGCVQRSTGSDRWIRQ